MPKTRHKLSSDKKNQRRRARAAELRAQKLRRSQAAKKGWETRRGRTEQFRQLQEELRLEKAKTEAVQNELLELRETARLVAEGKRELYDLFFREETPTERQARMLRYWRESDSLLGGRGVSRYGQLLLWIQRNGFEQKEFFAEYRRRKGR